MRVIYISQGIDSASEQHETLIAVHGLVDGLFLKEMAAKIFTRPRIGRPVSGTY